MASAETWLRQAEADLKAAGDSLAAGNNEWACYQAQQCAEKALKAYLYLKGRTAILTHALRQLVQDCVHFDPDFHLVLNDAKYLENFNIPTRYPNGLDADLAPAEYYDREDAEKCQSSAASILSAVKRSWSK